MRSQLKALSARLLEVREQERAAISRQVHDELGQALTALQWDVAKLTEEFSRHDTVVRPAARTRLKSMSDTLADALRTVRAVAAELRPPMLDQFGLLAAIRWQAGEFESRYGIACEVESEREQYAASRCATTAVFRIFQEILTNVARHAGASRVRARLAEESGAITLVVQDDGKGLPKNCNPSSLGILGMRERAWLLGGALEIASGRSAGTTVSVRIPLQNPHAKAETTVQKK
jgi:signal transduction histidine kinase